MEQGKTKGQNNDKGRIQKGSKSLLVCCHILCSVEAYHVARCTMFACPANRKPSLYGDSMKSLELSVSYPSRLYPFESIATVLIEYKETEEGREIDGLYVSEYVPESLVDYVKIEAKEQFYNLEKGK